MSISGWQSPVLKTVAGGGFAVRHAWCIGRNYAEHAREMGADPEREPPIFFSKPATALVQCSEIHYPPLTGELHHEVELVAFLGAGGRDLSSKQAQDCISAFAVGCDLTRRDVQARAKASGQPWALAKGFDQSGPVGELVPAGDWQPDPGRLIELAVNGEIRQRARLDEMIWPLPEMIARLSREITLHPGDAIFTGTPAGVGPLVAGDSIVARIEGLPELAFSVTA